MKKIIAIILIILSFCGYHTYRTHTQNNNWHYFFENPQKSIFKISYVTDTILNYEFYKKLSSPLSTYKVVKYNPCMFSDEILTLNKKHKAFPQNKLENLFNSQCRKLALKYNNNTYYRFGHWLCYDKEKCESILLQFDDFLVLEGERVFQTSNNTIVELDYTLFFKEKLKINSLNDVLLMGHNNTGIGNNLFQYYGAYVFAKKTGKELIVLKKHQNHDIFSNMIQPNDVISQFQTIDYPFYQYRTIDFNEDRFLFNQNSISFQNFIGYEDDIKNQTVFSHPLSEHNQKIATRMQQENSVSIHIRRGDFKEEGIHILKMSYYDNAIQYINNHIEKPHFYIFSDDIKWCKENFKTSHPHTFVDWNKKDYEDLHLMTLCKHNIIANSSFSWWGGFLNKNSDKIVVVPKHGFYSHENKYSNKDLISFDGCVQIDE